MNRDEIIAAIETLATAQGFYGRVLETLAEMRESRPNDYEALMSDLESQSLADAVDLCIFLET